MWPEKNQTALYFVTLVPLFRVFLWSPRPQLSAFRRSAIINKAHLAVSDFERLKS